MYITLWQGMRLNDVSNHFQLLLIIIYNIRYKLLIRKLKENISILTDSGGDRTLSDRNNIIMTEKNPNGKMYRQTKINNNVANTIYNSRTDGTI